MDAPDTLRVFVGTCISPADGKWFEVDSETASEVADYFASRNVEEYEISDAEPFYSLSASTVARCSLEHLAELVQIVCELSDDDTRTAYTIYVENNGGNVWEDWTSSFEDSYRGKYDSLEAWAEEYADSTGMLDSIPQNLRGYFDLEAWARDQVLGGDTWTETHAGYVYVFDNV